MRTTAKTTKANCIQCGIEFKPKRGSVGKFCTMACKHDHTKSEKINGRTSYFNCCKCHALLGFGIGVSARLIGVAKGSINQGMKNAGIKRYIPNGGSWRLTAQKTKNWWFRDSFEKSAITSAWMDDYKVKYPDWSELAVVNQYRRMTKEQKARKGELAKKRLQRCPVARRKKQESIKKWKAENPDKTRSYNKKAIAKRKIIDPAFKVMCNLRNRFKDIMQKAKKGGTKYTSSLIGCSSLHLAKHLESQFAHGMSWDNYGQWHVDHVLPCSSFNHSDPKQVAQCWHWTNLSPLWAKDNLAKSNKIIKTQMSLLLEIA